MPNFVTTTLETMNQQQVPIQTNLTLLRFQLVRFLNNSNTLSIRAYQQPCAKRQKCRYAYFTGGLPHERVKQESLDLLYETKIRRKRKIWKSERDNQGEPKKCQRQRRIIIFFQKYRPIRGKSIDRSSKRQSQEKGKSRKTRKAPKRHWLKIEFLQMQRNRRTWCFSRKIPLLGQH